MENFRRANINDLPAKHKVGTESYEYTRKKFVPFGVGNTLVSVYEIPPHKSAYPYHYHHKNEETFYIISGTGRLRTPQGESAVGPGDLLYFPANENGAHKLTNTSDTQPLVYIDFDVVHDIDVTVYPDSNKIAVWGKDTNRVYRTDDDVDYYTGE